MNRIITSLFAAAASVAVSAAPALSRVEPNTGDLLELLQASGVRVTYNHPDHCDGSHYGTYMFAGLQRQMNLCPEDTIDAVDHLTVRHETWHAIQHCVNAGRGTPANTPVQTDTAELADAVNKTLSVETVDFIKQAYPTSEMLVEFEAFTAAEIFTATELIEIYSRVCTASW
jgi:hypothetical protein